MEKGVKGKALCAFAPSVNEHWHVEFESILQAIITMASMSILLLLIWNEEKKIQYTDI